MKLAYKIKNNKFLFAIICIFAIIFILDLMLVGFDIAEIVIASANSAKLANSFLWINISGIIINFVLIIIIVVLLFLRKDYVLKSNKR